MRPKRSDKPSGKVVGERLRQPEDDDEGEDSRSRDEVEILLRERRENAALHADHGPDEGIHQNQ